MADLKGITGITVIGNDEFAKASEKGITRFNNIKLDSFAPREYVKDGVKREIAIVTIKVGDAGVVEGVTSMTMINYVTANKGVDLVMDYIGTNEYKGVVRPTFDIKAKL